jgi:hypothetical protein
MGNSVGVSSSASFTSSHAEFSRLEKMCSNYYFFDHFTEYEQAVLRAIDNNAIDALEVLLPAGNSKRLLPLHMSCRAGRLEPTELLLSAGFNCYMQDGDGRLPLHICSMVTSFESSLCATLILLNSAKSVSAIDHEGNTPIHTAVLHNNIHVLEAFMRNKVNINISNSKGKTPYQLAKERSHTDILRLFASNSSPVVDEKDDRQQRRNRIGRGEQKRKGKRGGEERDRRDVRRSRSLDSSQVDYDRIMQVWERFFENAALSKAGIPLDDDDDNDDDDDVNYCKPSSPNKTGSKAWGRCDDKHASWEAPRAKSQSASSDPKPYPHSTRGGLDSLFVDTRMSAPSSSLAYSNNIISNSRISSSSSSSLSFSHEDIDISTRRPPSPERIRSVNDDLIRAVGWFDWIVCYDFAKYEESSSCRDHHPYEEDDGEDFCSAERCYYVVHKTSKQCRWLHDHVELLQAHMCSHSFLMSFGNDWHDYELHMQYSLPITLLEVVLRGWLTYYDSCENLCKWINIPTKSFELTLPLGIGEHSSFLEELNLSPSASDQLWYLPDQSCAYMWVIVIYNCSSTMEDVVTVTNVFSDDDMEGCNASSLDNSFYSKKASMSSSFAITATEHKDRSTDEHTNTKAASSSASSVWEQQQHQSMDGDVPAYGIYYRNRITGESSWNAPVGWDYLVASWDDWTLCCNEESYDELYW